MPKIEGILQLYLVVYLAFSLTPKTLSYGSFSGWMTPARTEKQKCNQYIEKISHQSAARTPYDDSLPQYRDGGLKYDLRSSNKTVKIRALSSRSDPGSSRLEGASRSTDEWLDLVRPHGCDADVSLLCPRSPESLVHPGLRVLLRLGFGIRVPSGSLAIRPRRSRVVCRRPAPLVARAEDLAGETAPGLYCSYAGG